MSTSTHDCWTAGPWVVTHQTETDHSFDVVAPDERGGSIIATCGKSMNTDSDIAANAHLIAAAPEMYEALESIMAVARENEWPRILQHGGKLGVYLSKEHLDRAESVLSAARGERQ